MVKLIRGSRELKGITNIFIYISIIGLSVFLGSCSDDSIPQREKITCKDVDCGSGKCKVVDKKAICECDEGYHKMGLSCVENGNSCVGLDCGNGKCIIENDKATCECPSGYSGSQCDACDDTYQDNDNNKTCEKTCETSGLDCGENGICVDSSGSSVCDCTEGWTGALCSVFDGSKISLKLSDQWGRDIDFDKFTVTMEKNGESVDMDSFNFEYNLLGVGDYVIKLESDDYFPLEFKFKFIGENIENGIKDITLVNLDNSNEYPVTKHAYVYLKEEPNNIIPNWHHKFYIGVAHKWFTATGSPFSKNKVILYTSPENAWNDIADDLEASESEINAVTWAFKSDLEIRRSEEILPESQRKQNRIIEMLEQENVKTRIIVAQIWAQDSWLTAWQNNDDLKEKAENPDDDFEFMAQANETNTNYKMFFKDASLSQRLMNEDKDFRFKFANTFVEEQYIDSMICGDRDEGGNCTFSHNIDLHVTFDLKLNIASYHQKFFTMDRKIAYVGGINMSEEYWDTEEHGVFDHRRMPFKASESDREKVRDGNGSGVQKPADTKPYKDYFTRVEGPLVKDVHDVFSLRWNHLIYNRVNFSENSTTIDIMDSYAQEEEEGVEAQITLTMPRPFQDNTILESHLLAIKQAKHYIFIEDQYFRMPIVNKMIAVRMRNVPSLKLIVVTQPIEGTGSWVDVGCYWTSVSYKFFMDNFSSRTAFYQLKSFDYTYPKKNCDSCNFSPSCLTACTGDEMEGYFKKFYVHSKMIIIDDKYMSVGSANKNNRGFIYEGEMNIAIVDEDWVKRERKKIFKTILGNEVYSDVSSWEASDFTQMYAKFAEISSYNQGAYEEWDGWDDNNGGEHLDIDVDADYTSVSKENALPNKYKPKGLLYPLSFVEPNKCNFEDIGVDTAK